MKNRGLNPPIFLNNEVRTIMHAPDTTFTGNGDVLRDRPVTRHTSLLMKAQSNTVLKIPGKGCVLDV
jgi:hypothetical protein